MDNNEIQKRLDEVSKRLGLLFEQHDALSKVERERLEEAMKFVGQPRKPDITEAEALIWFQETLFLKSRADEACRRVDLVRGELEVLTEEAARLAGLLDKDGRK